MLYGSRCISNYYTCSRRLRPKSSWEGHENATNITWMKASRDRLFNASNRLCLLLSLVPVRLVVFVVLPCLGWSRRKAAAVRPAAAQRSTAHHCTALSTAVQGSSAADHSARAPHGQRGHTRTQTGRRETGRGAPDLLCGGRSRGPREEGRGASHH